MIRQAGKLGYSECDRLGATTWYVDRQHCRVVASTFVLIGRRCPDMYDPTLDP